MPVCNQGEFFMEPKEVEHNIILEEVSTTDEIPEEVDTSREEWKGVGHDKVLEILPPMKDNPHHIRLLFMVSKIFFCITTLLKITTFNITWLELEDKFFFFKEGLMYESGAKKSGSIKA